MTSQKQITREENRNCEHFRFVHDFRCALSFALWAKTSGGQPSNRIRNMACIIVFTKSNKSFLFTFVFYFFFFLLRIIRYAFEILQSTDCSLNESH